MQQITDIVMATKVPSAEPMIPMPMTYINNRFKNMFKMEEKIRKYSGVLLSPKARMKPDSRL